MARWTFKTLDGTQTYTFTINPNDQENPVPARDIRWDLNIRNGFAGTRAGRTPTRWSFSGVLRDQAQYDAFLLWLNKKTKIRLTTDLGQQYIVRLLTFKPTQEARGANAHAPWRHTYTIDCLIFETEAVL